MGSRREGDGEGARAVRGTLRRRAGIGVLYALLVDLAAFAAVGLLRPQIPWSWDVRSTLEAGPLARFDSGWYASIARDGYQWDFRRGTGNIVFFPLYPPLMRALSSVSGFSPFLSGSVLSHLFFFAGLVALAAYFGEDRGRPDPAAVIFSLLAWPWAFFLTGTRSTSFVPRRAAGVGPSPRRWPSWIPSRVRSRTCSGRGFFTPGPRVDLVGPLFLLVALFWLARRHHVAEALYVGTGALLILMSGDLASSGRYALVLFPAFRFAAGFLRSPRR